MRSTLFLSLFPSYPTRSAASKGFVLPCSSPLLSEAGFMAAVFFSHPDESNNAENVIAVIADRRMVFIGATGDKPWHRDATNRPGLISRPFVGFIDRLERINAGPRIRQFTPRSDLNDVSTRSTQSLLLNLLLGHRLLLHGGI